MLLLNFVRVILMANRDPGRRPEKSPSFRLTSKGQVTIPQYVREQAGIALESEVQFEVRRVPGDTSGKVEVVIRPVPSDYSPLKTALQAVRGVANANEFKGMSTDAFMKFLRG
jgi:bifunctional DNA-binding transcriptional regulator/antitoxin component of YhaV-PrlF toxin-antitoxin module